jgi:hypothetical protein
MNIPQSIKFLRAIVLIPDPLSAKWKQLGSENGVPQPHQVSQLRGRQSRARIA